MRWTKRLGSLLLAGCLTMSALPALAVDADVEEEPALQEELEKKAVGLAASGYVCTKETNYNSDSKLINWSEYTYNENGNMTLYKIYNSDGSVYGWYEYDYDANGNRASYKYYNSDGSVGDWYEYAYDANSNMTRETRCNSDGSVSYWYEYAYDENGNMTRETRCDSDGSVASWQELAYDAIGNKTEEKWYKSDGSMYLRYEYTYDTSGNMTLCKLYSSSGKVNSWYEYTYDANGNMTRCETYSSSGILWSWYVYVYDTNGNEVRETFYNSDGSVDGWNEYEYTALCSRHTWNAGEVTTAATAISTGVKTYTCTVCGVTKTETIAKLSIPFTDILSDQWYTDAVLWAVNNNITNGMTSTTFEPGGSCTRAQIVTFLWRNAGSPEPTSPNHPFTDVNADAYYYKAVLWAVENGITKGTSDTTFSPGATCKRSEAVTFLWRANSEPTVSASNPFTDVPSGTWYTGAVLWAVANKITDGMSPTTFAPNSTCTRAHIVTFLYRAAA